MAKLLCAALVLAMAGSALAITANPTNNSTHVMVRMELDNTVKEVNASMATLKKNIAKELCGVADPDVTILKVVNDDTKVAGIGNTQTVVYAACKAPTNRLEGVLDDCEDMWNRHQVKDETQDSTSWWKGGEVEVDDVECRYVENGQFEYFSKADATRAGSTTAAGTADTAIPAPLAGSAAGAAVPAAVTAMALAGAALLLAL